MAPRLALLLLASAALVLAVPTTLAQDATCGTPVAVADAADDQTLFPAGPAPDAVRHAELDVLATTLALDGDEVVLTATLGAVPTAESAYSYRYWFGFHVKPASGEPEYMDVRMHGKDDLAGAHLITSNEQGNERIAEVAPTWDGTTATFRFALALLHEVYGSTDLKLGQPEASTDGPFNQEVLMWFPTGVVYQVDNAPDGRGDWVAYEACPAAPAQPAQPPAPTQASDVAPTEADPAPAQQEAPPQGADGQDAPGAGFAALAIALVAAGAFLRRR